MTKDKEILEISKSKTMKEEEYDEYDIADITCPRCNCCDMTWEDCCDCGGEGVRDGEDLMEEDPLWYSPDDFEVCNECNGKGGFWMCTCDENGKHIVKSLNSQP